MFLKSLEMQGFKSFPDKTVLTFGSGMTAVVGPNGSGKSNISDAVRWVLGEQSTKNLRGSRMEDVIFGGTANRKAQGIAQVSLCLDNKDGKLGRDEDEITVTRRYYRSGESEYEINGETVRLKDINELFMDTGLGRDGYSLVGQGKVADMVSEKSNERRDMLEEAAGISHFRYRRADALRRLTSTEENLVRLRDILAELECRVGPLKSQSEKAEKFIKFAEEKKSVEIGLWLNTINQSKDSLKSADDKLTIANAQYEDIEKELDDIESGIEKNEESIAGINVEIDEIRHESEELDEKTSAKEAEIAVAKNTIEHNLQTIERIKEQKSEGEKARQETDEQIKDFEEKIKENESEIELKKEELQKLTARTDEIVKEAENNLGISGNINRELSDITLALSDIKIKISGNASSIEEINNRTLSVRENVKQKNEEIKNTEEEKAQLLIKGRESAEKLSETENSIKGYEKLAESKRQKLEKSKENLDRQNAELKTKLSKAAMLSELEKNMEGYQGSVKAVVKEAKRGVLSGVHGPVSSLISSDEKYALAVETALGASIQNIVVDSENDAKRAVKYLKDNNCGRATFLPMTSIKSRSFEEKGLSGCDGFISMANELVTFDNKYKSIINSLLSRVAVVSDMDSAISISKKFGYRFKTVTLDGQVMNAGGSITGGSRVRNAGLLSRSNEIEKINSECEKLKENIKDSEAIYKQTQEELSKAVADYDGAFGDLNTVKMNISAVDSALSFAEEKLNTAKTELSNLITERDTADTRISALEEATQTSKEQEEELEKKADALREKLLTLTEGNAQQASEKEELTKKSSEKELEIMSLSKDVAASEDIIGRLKARTSESSEKEDALSNEIAEINAENENTLQKIEDMKNQLTELKTSGTNGEDRIKELGEKRNEISAESNKLRTFEKNKTSERERLSGELARLSERKINLLKDYDDTVAKLYDEYQLTKREALEISSPSEDIPSDTKKLNELKSKIRALGNVNVGAIEEYKEVSGRYEFMTAQITDIEISKRELEKLIEELTHNMAARFKEQFVRINNEFRQTFSELFGGGNASLSLADENDVLESRINIKAQPPGKAVQNIDLLSGGEKGLTAIALLFAILKINPAPFCIFDEVEAALDDVNVSRYAQYVRRITDNTQFILITHRRGTMEEADVLYGVTMQEKGVSKLLELKTAEMVEKLGLEEK